MDLGELVGKNAAAIIAVIGTVSGALVVSVSNWGSTVQFVGKSSPMTRN